ncbi:pyrin and HIN domain-containing protein 1-like [Octodon degus]|uniref:Pyrin and HIN domain-containing protein 1-like n=1 Tax=Octodon degus TaxID=10160 RepID=A0A6P6D645_OCTDE|nr:pyrin and HIN domain-containing protein 1-like [Octodon degus]
MAELNLLNRQQNGLKVIEFAEQTAKWFKSDAGMEKLIELFKDKEELEDWVKFLRELKSKVLRECRERAKSTGKESLQKKSSTIQCMINTDVESQSESEMDAPVSKKKRVQCVPSEPSEECGSQPGSKAMMVLKVTKPFTYGIGKDEKMLHAIMADEQRRIQVKVFDITVKDKFIPNTVIALSNYVTQDGFLEIHKSKTVSHVCADQGMNISCSYYAKDNLIKIWIQFRQTCLFSEYISFPVGLKF